MKYFIFPPVEDAAFGEADKYKFISARNFFYPLFKSAYID